MFERIIIVTRKTRLAELIERFNTRGQVKFYLDHSGGDFSEYETEDSVYNSALDSILSQLQLGLKLQTVERQIIPTLVINENDLLVTVGQDGLVANTAKYAGSQPIVAVNPDTARFDGVLLPFSGDQAGAAVRAVLEGRAAVNSVTLAEAKLGDGQRLLAFNDLFIGASSHISARYRIEYKKCGEEQSSSGIIVSTGAGSTGWLSSVFNMAAGVAKAFGGTAPSPPVLRPEDKRLVFAVREPFLSKHSQASIGAGVIDNGENLAVKSRMPVGGVIFSDGMESDFLEFNSGAAVTIQPAAQRACLVKSILAN